MAPSTYNAHATHRMLDLDGVQLASFARRAAAFAVDCLFIVIVVTACVVGRAAAAKRLNLLPVGKRLARIRVVSTLHPKISLWHSFERALGYAASALELGFGFLPYFIAENRQTTHDRIAGTIVIEEAGGPRPHA